MRANTSVSIFLHHKRNAPLRERERDKKEKKKIEFDFIFLVKDLQPPLSEQKSIGYI